MRLCVFFHPRVFTGTLRSCASANARGRIHRLSAFSYGSTLWNNAMRVSSLLLVALLRSDSALVSINEVKLCRAWLELGWVTVSGFNSSCGTFISVCNQPPRSTQPGHPFVGKRNEYQPKGGDALRLGSKGRYGMCVSGR